jgi:Transposase DDE domain
MSIVSSHLERIKNDPAQIVRSEVVEDACRKCGYIGRKRRLTPVMTLRAFVAQVANGNSAISDIVGLFGHEFTESAYCQARQRLPLSVIKAVTADFTRRMKQQCDRGSAGLYNGHRTVLIDGTGVTLPDTSALRKHFGTRNKSKSGLGMPLAMVLTLFDADTGLLLDMTVAEATANDHKNAHLLHPSLQPGDVLVGDRGLCSYAHIAMLKAADAHGVFRVGKSRSMPFPAPPGPRERNSYNRHRSSQPVLVRQISPDDQIVEIVKPHNRPRHLTPEGFAAMPPFQTVRAIRYRVERPGCRTSEVILMTTLLDEKKYPAASLAELYLTRWQIELNIRHLKRTMNMERLKCQSVEGVQRELAVFAIVYNAVAAVRAMGAKTQNVAPSRISFIDTLRWLRRRSAGKPIQISAPDKLIVLPLRPPRVHPRMLKRRGSEFPVMRRSRAKIIKWLTKHHPAN